MLFYFIISRFRDMSLSDNPDDGAVRSRKMLGT
jgi:hypothetical protein